MPFLQFKGRSAVESYHYSLPHHTLEMDKSLSLLEGDSEPALDGNLIIEGDNLLALKSLLPTHAGRIKCIYIDPPYNTGNEGWIYNDNLTQPQFKEWIGQTVGKEGEDAARHDKWCCMIFPRLMILRDLLREDGVIFISIDEREVANLTLLMEEVFGNNQIATLVWSGRSGKGATTQNVEMTHEYILVYCKNSALVKLKQVENVHEGGVYEDRQGKYNREQLRQWGQGDRREDRPSMYFPILGQDDEEIYPLRADGTDGRWRCGEATVQQLLEDGDLDFVKNADETFSIYRKIREGRITTSASDSMLLDQGSASSGTIQIKRMFGGAKVFPTVKPVSLIKHLVELACSDDKTAIIIDSFAGSGTTAHAVMELNNQDEGNRSFILVQQKNDTKDDEKKKANLCQNITRERVFRAIKGYTYSTKKKTVSMEALGGSFTYARVSEKPLFGDYKEFSDKLPPYNELAKYVFYTETSREWNPAGINLETGKIGENAGVSYYLLYRADEDTDWRLDLDFLNRIAIHDANRQLVIYHEKFWMHREQLQVWQEENGKRVRSMQIPFQMR